MSQAGVSVLIVSYNHSRYIVEAVRSALDQTVSPHEVIVVDDGSTDDTVTQIKQLRDPRVVVIPQAHRGIAELAETYNAGLAASRGELVALLEGDDRWPTRKLERQIRHFGDPRVVLSHGWYAVIGADGGTIHPGVAPSTRPPPGPYEPRQFILRGSYIMMVTAVVRRRTLLEAGGFQQLRDTSHCDYSTFLRLAEHGMFHYEPSVLGEWRRHTVAATYRSASMALEGIDEALRLALDARSRLFGSTSEVPSDRDIRKSWGDLYSEQAWQTARLLLADRRRADARHIILRALGRSARLALRLRLLAALTASLLRIDLEALVWLIGGRSVIRDVSRRSASKRAEKDRTSPRQTPMA